MGCTAAGFVANIRDSVTVAAVIPVQRREGEMQAARGATGIS